MPQKVKSQVVSHSPPNHHLIGQIMYHYKTYNLRYSDICREKAT